MVWNDSGRALIGRTSSILSGSVGIGGMMAEEFFMLKKCPVAMDGPTQSASVRAATVVALLDA